MWIKVLLQISLIGRRRAYDPAVMEEPKSPANLAGTKRKICFNSPQGSSKRQIMGSSQVHFDSIILTPNVARPTRRSTRTAKVNTRKNVGGLFQRLGQEFRAVAKTYEEIAGAMD